MNGFFKVPGMDGKDGSVAKGQSQWPMKSGVVECPVAVGHAEGWVPVLPATPAKGEKGQKSDKPATPAKGEKGDGKGDEKPEGDAK